MMVKLFGINNCSTVKKAKDWLSANAIKFEFIDFKKNLPNQQLIEVWLKDISIEILLNRKGMTWRKLTDEEKFKADRLEYAINLMVDKPSIIKRPILMIENKTYVGFNNELYQTIFNNK